MNAAAMLESIKSRFQADLYDSPEEAESAWQEMLAEEIEEIEAEAEKEAAAEARFQDWLTRGQAVIDCAQAVRDAVPGLKLDGNDSQYGSYRQRIKIRVADHYAPAGSGWNEAKQERYQEPSVNFVVTSKAEIPSRAEIRARIAKALRAAR